jgi:mRNA-degrading endonuclease RelE of RelBE toxin-antitoxin system
VSRATEIYAREFDSVFLKLSPSIRNLIEGKINDLGSRLSEYPHHRLKGRSEYRVIYEFDKPRNTLYLLTLGHRREIYR